MNASNSTTGVLLDPGGLLEPGQVTNPGNDFVDVSFIYHLLPGIDQNTITKQVLLKRGSKGIRK